MEGFSDGSSTLPASTKVEPDEHMNQPFTWWAVCSSWFTRFCGKKNKKEASIIGVFPFGGSLFLFHSHNAFRYFLTNASGILKSLLEFTAKEHGYD